VAVAEHVRLSAVLAQLLVHEVGKLLRNIPQSDSPSVIERRREP
jgi:hypothetical protein